MKMRTMIAAGLALLPVHGVLAEAAAAHANAKEAQAKLNYALILRGERAGKRRGKRDGAKTAG